MRKWDSLKLRSCCKAEDTVNKTERKYFFVYSWDMFSLCRLVCHKTYSMENPVLKLKNLPVSIFQVLVLNTYTTTTQKSLLVLRVLNCLMFRIKLTITLNINLPQFMALFSQVSLHYSSECQTSKDEHEKYFGTPISWEGNTCN